MVHVTDTQTDLHTTIYIHIHLLSYLPSSIKKEKKKKFAQLPSKQANKQKSSNFNISGFITYNNNKNHYTTKNVIIGA